MDIIFATGNNHKLREIRQILDEPSINIISMRDAGIDIDIEENGVTFEENALTKARALHAYLMSGEYSPSEASAGYDLKSFIVMADDSGLEVDALNGEPGIYSARYLGEDTPHSEKNKSILERMEGIPDEKRTARFVCAAAAVFPDGHEEVVRETMEGNIAHGISGTNGFGYDPIFFLPEHGMTSAEITPEEKNRISHRGKALRAMKQRIFDRNTQV